MLVLFPPQPAMPVFDSDDLKALLDDLSPVVDDPDVEVVLVAVDGPIVVAIIAARCLPDLLTAALVAAGAEEIWILWNAAAPGRCECDEIELSARLREAHITVRGVADWMTASVVRFDE